MSHKIQPAKLTEFDMMLINIGGRTMTDLEESTRKSLDERPIQRQFATGIVRRFADAIARAKRPGRNALES